MKMTAGRFTCAVFCLLMIWLFEKALRPEFRIVLVIFAGFGLFFLITGAVLSQKTVEEGDWD
jgi:hypothetical protein